MDTIRSFGIVQEDPADKQHLLGLLLSIELYHPHTTCIISCTNEVQDYIEKFPKPIQLKLDFIPFDKNISCLGYIKNSLNTLTYAVKTYGECLLVGKDLIMTNKFSLSAEVKEQGIGFIRKTSTIIDAAHEFQRYSACLLYVNQTDYIREIISHYESKFACPNLFETNFAEYTDEQRNEQNKLCVEIYARLPLHLVQKKELTTFLTDYSYVGSEDFFAYENSIKMSELTKALTYKELPIVFCNIRTATLDTKIQQLNNYFLNMLVNKHIVYMSLLNLKMSSHKIQFVTPRTKGVGIWDRTKDANGGWYELIDYLVEMYPAYLSQVAADIDYFSVGNYLLTDKPSHLWLNNSIKKYSKLFVCNYDKSLVDALPTLPLANTFLFYYAYHPKVLETFLHNTPVQVSVERPIMYGQVTFNPEAKTFCLNNETIVDYSTLLEKLVQVKYGLMNKFNVNLIATYLAVGVVPVILDEQTPPIYDLVENEHYLIAKVKSLTESDYLRLQKNGLAYYQDHIRPAACFAKLLDHIFVRDIEWFYFQGDDHIGIIHINDATIIV